MDPEGAGWLATLELCVAPRVTGSALTLRRHSGPLRVQKALWPEGPELAHLLIVHPPGGIAGGDRLSIALDVAAHAQALVTTPGATKWYKANGAQAAQHVRLHVADDAALEWLPQENIVFDSARVDMSLRVDCAARARACGWEICVLGRQASHETFSSGTLAQHTAISCNDVLLWAERGSIEGNDALLASPLGWAGAHVSGLFWMIGADIDDALLEHCRTLGEARGEPVRLRDRITRMVGQLELTNRTSFRRMIEGATTRTEVIVDFMAVLELIKQRYLEAVQSESFGDIDLVKLEGAVAPLFGASNAAELEEDFTGV